MGKLFGFAEDEVIVEELLWKGYQEILIPLFSESKDIEVERIRNIIASYSRKKVVFICEIDQFYQDQFGVIADIQRKFYAAKSRKANKLTYSKANYNIAIHVRRGDISIGQENKNPNLLMRWQQNSYFTNVLSNVLRTVNTARPIAIYLFSQGSEGDFEDFRQFSKLHFCLDMNAHDSFLHMVFADLLITSKRSFSYNLALLNKSIKDCQKDFYHGYTEAED